MENTRGQFIGLVIVSVLAAWIAIDVPGKPKLPLIGDAKINLGIDLAGGAELTYRALREKNKDYPADVLQRVADVLHQRVNKSGLKDPKIVTSGDEMITIQLAGVDKEGLEDYKRLIERVGKLELAEVAPPDVIASWSGEAPPSGWVKKAVTDSRGVRADLLKNGKWTLVSDKPVIEGTDVKDARPDRGLGEGGGVQWRVRFFLHDAGAKRFDLLAERLFGMKPEPGAIAIMLDGEVKSMPTVRAAQFGGEGTISGGFSEQEARELGIILKSGNLPVAIGKRTVITHPDGREETKDVEKQPESENFVGPSLGQDSIRRGVIASLLSLILVAIFMAVYYRAGGLVSVLGLILNMVFLLAILAVFGATLTLPGIAGIVLTIGMAVDANILVYERVREEMAKGKTAEQAFDAGYDRAFVTIVDANVTSFVAALVLYYFGTGPVQGFAVTLMVGIITTMISVLWACKLVLKMMVQGGTIREWKMMQLFQTPSFKFTKYFKPMAAVSLLLVLGSVGILWARWNHSFGIEFTGGSMLQFSFSQETSIDKVRSVVSGIKGPDGLPKYADAEIQTIASSEAATRAPKLLAGAASTDFQMRTKIQEHLQVRDDLLQAFAKGGDTPVLSPGPFAPVKPEEVPQNDRWAAPKDGSSGAAGAGTWVHLADPEGRLDAAAFGKALRDHIAKSKDLELTRDINDEPILGSDNSAGEFLKSPGAGGISRIKVLVLAKDVELASADTLRKLRVEIERFCASKADYRLATDAFSSVQNIGAAVASQLYNSTFWAMVVAWGLMIIYIAIRFQRVAFGIAAVVALVHDALVAVGFMVLANTVVPHGFGLNFEMTLATVAAILTVIGYSINDTIVTFDRIRENLVTMKKESLEEIVDASVNQTLGRSILTSLTVWITCLVLYLFTMTSGGGIASFAFPMLMGAIVGTYSSIYIAAPFIVTWFGGRKPQVA